MGVQRVAKFGGEVVEIQASPIGRLQDQNLFDR
jgi:hypothetical protein